MINYSCDRSQITFKESSFKFRYFRAECENEGGTESGSCADGMLLILYKYNDCYNIIVLHFSLLFYAKRISILGFGVCCIRILGDGDSTSLNQSYIYQASSTSLGVGSRQYTICPCSSDVCRIKFDFTVKNYSLLNLILQLILLYK